VQKTSCFCMFSERDDCLFATDVASEMLVGQVWMNPVYRIILYVNCPLFSLNLSIVSVSKHYI
jgi:hypothetical protein